MLMSKTNLSDLFAAAVCESYSAYGEEWCHIGDLPKQEADAILSAPRPQRGDAKQGRVR
jgi:hypothetical protein